MGETLFRYRVSGGRFHISQGETLFRGRRYFVTPALNNRRYNPILLVLLSFYLSFLFSLYILFPSSVCTSFPLPLDVLRWIPPIIPIPSFCVAASSYLIFILL